MLWAIPVTGKNERKKNKNRNNKQHSSLHPKQSCWSTMSQNDFYKLFQLASYYIRVHKHIHIRKTGSIFVFCRSNRRRVIVRFSRLNCVSEITYCHLQPWSPFMTQTKSFFLYLWTQSSFPNGLLLDCAFLIVLCFVMR